MGHPYLHDNSGAVRAYYREHCDAHRVQGDAYEAFIQAMKVKWTHAGNSLTKFVWGIWQLWATNDLIRIDGFDGKTESNRGKFTSSCHISQDWYAFTVDPSNTSRPAHSEAERDEVVTRFKMATQRLLAA